MKTRIGLLVLLAAFSISEAASAGDTSAQSADSGPQIDLAPEHETKPPPPTHKPVIGLGSGTATDTELVRGMTEQRFRSALSSSASTSIGGYGEAQVRGTTKGRAGEREWVADIPRLVLFVAHAFNEKFRVYTEFEVEHSLSCASCSGSAEVEQAYVDWKVAGDWLGLRAGLVLVPMGIINQWHEPPVFHGVVRPKVDTEIIPSTWRELGAGFFGNPIEPLRYELYVMSGLDPLALRATGLAAARQGASFAHANSWAVTGRVEVEPLLGFVIGASGYASDAGRNADVFDAKGNKLEAKIPILGWSADARWRKNGFEWRVVYAEFRMPESGELMRTFDANGSPLFDVREPVPTTIRGGYVEAAYDVLRPFSFTSHQLLPFARLEAYSTQAGVPDGYSADPRLSVREYTFGASYRPIQQIVFKADYQLRNRLLGYDETQLNFGLGFMY
jgi:hypothetical protein